MQGTITFCLFSYFPHGGLQRDFLQIAMECRKRGAAVRVYTLSWKGAVPEGFDIRIVPIRALSNHRRAQNFSKWVHRELTCSPSLGTVGFNKMEGLDVYFASDSCFAARASAKRFFYRAMARYRTYLKMEQAVFGRDASSRILLIAPRQRDDFLRHYPESESRLVLLPPVLNPDFRCPAPEDARRQIRTEFKVKDDGLLLLQVGSSFRTKGVDRVVRALAGLPDELRKRCLFVVVGQGKTERYQALARRLGVEDHVRFSGVRQDVPELMAAADLLVHPARTEAAGMTITESLACGLPILCSGICGYAPYVNEASAGRVLDEPFVQKELTRALTTLLTGNQLSVFGKNALDYVRSSNPRNMHECAVDIIEEVIGKKR